MNILIINHYAGTPYHGMVFRPYYLAREWVKRGHEVTVVAASYSHLRYKNPLAAADCELEDIDGIKHLWLKTPAYQGNGLGRIMNILAFVGGLFRHRDRIIGDASPEVVISSPTYHLDVIPAYILARKAKAKFVFEVRDLWPLVPIELGRYSRFHPFIVAIGLAERAGYRLADLVVSVAPHAYDYMGHRGVDAERYAYIANGVSPPAQEGDGEGLGSGYENFFQKIRGAGCQVVGYAGSLRRAYALEYFVRCAALLKDERVYFVLAGQGDEEGALQKEIEHCGLDNAKIIKPVYKQQVCALLKHFDLCYTGFRKLSCFSYGVSSNKVFDYMLAGKPVLLAVDTPYATIVDMAACGKTVPAEDEHALAQAVKELLALDGAERQAMGERGRAYVLENHDYSRLSNKYLEAIRGARAPGKKARE